MKKVFLAITLLLSSITVAYACTNFIVGKDASNDGSTMISYNADSYWLFGSLEIQPAATHVKGAMRQIIDWDSQEYLGEIPEATQTYNVVGNMNEYQVAIGETTYGGLKELDGGKDSTALIDYGSLIYIALQRSKTAREAIVVMTSLVEKYGYRSSGESFSIADPNEVWIMDFIGKGIGEKGAVWVAVRVPDDCISAHANQARITTFDLESRKNKHSISSKHIKHIYRPEVNVVYKHDVIKFARKKGYFDGKDEDFSFSDTYNPLDFGGLRFCEARVWSFFRHFDAPLMDKYISYINGETKERMPLWIKANRKVSLKDMQDCMRDHYEGTPLDMTQGMGSGAHHTPFRRTPLVYKHNDTEYYHERPTATQQTGFSFIAQMRSWLPRQIGGIFWFGADDATVNCYVPMYCSMTEAPLEFSTKDANLLEFSWNSAFWVNNWIGMMAYAHYEYMIPHIKKAQNKLERQFEEEILKTDMQAKEMKEEDRIMYLTQFSKNQSKLAHYKWSQLGQFLLVKYVDGAVKSYKNGEFEQNDRHVPNNLTRPGYSAEYIENELVNPNPERFKMKTQEEMDNRK